MLKIGKDGFTLPLDLVTSTQAILARKRSGKSYTASVEAEEMLDQKQQVIVFDPTSAWHGIRSSSDGTGEGYSIVVFGGDHADAPLDSMAGKAMAAAVVELGFSAIFDISNLHTEEQIQFVMDFSSELLRINRTALHVFMDEADTFAPQKPISKLSQKCLGTVSRLVKQGGIRGVGFTMITQRPASMNKDVLSQVDILTVLRMSHPLDIKAATDWIASEVSVAFAGEVKAALPSLPVGTAFFCSASLGLGERVAVRTRKTFNSGATPKPGERKVEPKVLAKVDIEKLGAEISASVKRTKEDSPEFLKQRIAELEAKGANVGMSDDIAAMERELEELRPLKGQVEEAHRKQDTAERVVMSLSGLFGEMKAIVERFEVELGGGSPLTEHIPEPVRLTQAARISTAPSAPVEVGDVQINDPRQRILNAIATLGAIRGATVTLEWIACTAGTTPRARGFEENLRVLRKAGLIDGIRLTAEGAEIAKAESTMPTWNAILARLGSMLSSPQENILRVLKGRRLSAANLADAVDTTERARGFEENTRQLVKKGYIFKANGAYGLINWLEAMR